NVPTGAVGGYVGSNPSGKTRTSETAACNLKSPPSGIDVIGAPDMSVVVSVTCNQQGAAAQASGKRSSSRSIRSERSQWPASRWSRSDDFQEERLTNCA